MTIQSLQAQNLPLAAGCNGKIPLDYETPISCVSGYVYVDGQPMEGAEVTIIAPNGNQQQVLTEIPAGTNLPSFLISLGETPLNIQPSDIVTITASYDQQSKTDTFMAREGTIQIDIVLPHDRTDSAWTHAYLSARHDHALSYDQARQEIVLFGGYTTKGDFLGDTWVRHAGQWIQKTPPNSPHPRRGHALVYHQERQQVLLFGGQDEQGGYLNDLWAWNGSRWAELGSEAAPPARTDHTVAYDEVYKQMIVFGGYNGGGSLGDTWIWTGGSSGSWRQGSLNGSPPKRLHHGMVYNSHSQKVLLFGGRSDVDNTALLLDDSWIWDGISWRQQEVTAKPPPLAGHAIVYGEDTQKVYLFGGVGADGRLQDSLWAWDGETWSEQLEDEAVGDWPRARDYHALVYEPEQKQVMLFGGLAKNLLGVRDLADTWHWQPELHTWAQSDALPSFTQWKKVAMVHEQDGDFLVFGGLVGNEGQGTPQSATFRWRSTEWEELAPENHPPARYGHRLARANDGRPILLFGGIGQGGEFLDDSWLWNGQDWIAQTPTEHPSARAYYALAYDSQQGEWLLFGGLDEQGEILNDLWSYNGSQWQRRNAPNPPAARMLSSFVYDPESQETLLFAGKGAADSYYNDLWAWDGMGWEERTTSTQPEPRAGHSATYDPIRQQMVVAGGENQTEEFRETWVWDSHAWRKRHDLPELSMFYLNALDHDPVNDLLVGMGEENGGNQLGEGLLIHEAYSATLDAAPIGTIRYVAPKDVLQSEQIIFEGQGSDGDSTDIITAHRWTHDETVISTQAAFSITASTLPLGTQIIRYDVQDDEGNWSQEQIQQIYVRDDEGCLTDCSTPILGQQPTWTLLIYAAADNDLARWLGDDPYRKGMLYRLQRAGTQARTQVGILYDGDGEDDTYRYVLTPDGRLQEEAVDEADMGAPETLQDFLEWGYAAFESDYYALHIASHANGIIGIGLDEHGEGDSPMSVLTPLELRSSLQLATESRGRRLEIIHFDGCSFGLLENAAIAADLAHYVVASPNTALGFFSYEHYRKLAADSLTPRDYGRAVAEHYATRTSEQEIAYTISLFNMAHFEKLRMAVDELGNLLLAYARSNLGEYPKQLADLRDQVQKYDSGGRTEFKIDDEDEYVDLGSLANILASNLVDESILSATEQVTTTLAQFVEYESHASGDLKNQQGHTYAIGLDQSHGVGIYYPKSASSASNSAYAAYQQNSLFHITKGWGWSNFITFGIPPLGPGEPPLMDQTNLLPPMVIVEDPPQIYLPLFIR